MASATDVPSLRETVASVSTSFLVLLLMLPAMVLFIISLPTGCGKSTGSKISYVPEADRIFFIYQGDSILNSKGIKRILYQTPDGNDCYALPYDGIVISNTEHWRLLEK